MSLDGLRAVALGVQFAVMGVAITVTRPAPDDQPIGTMGIWLEPLEEARAMAGTDFQRLDARKILAVPRSDTLPSLPRGTTIAAAELEGGLVKLWRVDGYHTGSHLTTPTSGRAVEPDLMRVSVMQMSDLL